MQQHIFEIKLVAVWRGGKQIGHGTGEPVALGFGFGTAPAFADGEGEGGPEVEEEGDGEVEFLGYECWKVCELGSDKDEVAGGAMYLGRPAKAEL